MEIKELARQLGISHQMANRYKSKGMPVHSVEAAITWRKSNVDPFRSKKGRIDGNTGLKRGTINDRLITAAITETLTNIVPKMWFSQIGWLGSAMRDHGVHVTVEQVVKIQAILFMVYMAEVDEFLKKENKFTLPDTLMARPGDQIHFAMIEELTEILNQEPIQLYETQ